MATPNTTPLPTEPRATSFHHQNQTSTSSLGSENPSITHLSPTVDALTFNLTYTGAEASERAIKVANYLLVTGTPTFPLNLDIHAGHISGRIALPLATDMAGLLRGLDDREKATSYVRARLAALGPTFVPAQESWDETDAAVEADAGTRPAVTLFHEQDGQVQASAFDGEYVDQLKEVEKGLLEPQPEVY